MMSRALSGVLRYGALLAIVILAIGFAHVLIAGHGSVEWLTPSMPIGEVPAAFLAFQSNAWLVAGLFVLVALPFARVFMSALVFAIEKDWVFFGISMLVFGIMLTGIFFRAEL